MLCRRQPVVFDSKVWQPHEFSWAGLHVHSMRATSQSSVPWHQHCISGEVHAGSSPLSVHPTHLWMTGAHPQVLTSSRQPLCTDDRSSRSSVPWHYHCMFSELQAECCPLCTPHPPTVYTPPTFGWLVSTRRFLPASPQAFARSRLPLCTSSHCGVSAPLACR